MTWIELIATLFGLACVWFYIRQSIWSWPTGLVQVCLYVWIFFQARLYSDFLLQLVYVVLQLYGWYYWLRGSGKQAGEVPVVRLARAAAVAWLGVAVVGTAILGFVMRRYTNAALPYWDAAITVLSLIAQALLARKVLENWPIWVTVDVLAIGVYLAKGLYITTGLYAVFLGMAIAGWIAWQRSYRIASAKGFDGAAASSSASSSPLTAGTSS
jgi:nicotinamide mononucleotide transporter